MSRLDALLEMRRRRREARRQYRVIERAMGLPPERWSTWLSMLVIVAPGVAAAVVVFLVVP